jgi:hypothetical protein
MDHTFSGKLAHKQWCGCHPYALAAALYHPGRFLVLISFRGYSGLEGFGKSTKSIDLIILKYILL